MVTKGPRFGISAGQTLTRQEQLQLQKELEEKQLQLQWQQQQLQQRFDRTSSLRDEGERRNDPSLQRGLLLSCSKLFRADPFLDCVPRQFWCFYSILRFPYSLALAESCVERTRKTDASVKTAGKDRSGSRQSANRRICESRRSGKKTQTLNLVSFYDLHVCHGL